MKKTPAARPYKQNRLQQLRGFCLAAQTGSVSLAARRLTLSQPSVTLQIQALEREFGVRLFDRHGPRISLTPDGQYLYELAAPLVESVDGLAEAFAATRDDVRGGPLVIAAGESTILYILPPLVQRFAAAYPGVEIKLRNVTGEAGLALLRAGDVEMAVGSMIDVPDDILYEPMFTYEPVLITAREHPLAARKRVTLDAIARFPLILPPRHLTTSPLIDRAFRERKLEYSVRLEAGGWEVIKRYVALGVGVSIVTNVCLTGDEALVARSLTAYFPRRSYGLVLRKGRALSPQARRFIALLGARSPERSRGSELVE